MCDLNRKMLYICIQAAVEDFTDNNKEFLYRVTNKNCMWEDIRVQLYLWVRDLASHSDRRTGFEGIWK
jgi:hypothetical protein